MPNYTKNLGLTKPLPEEFYDVNVRNENWDKIDEAVGTSFRTGNILNIDQISGEGIFNVMPTATGTFPPELNDRPAEVRHVGVLMHKVWDGNYAEQVFFSYATLKAFKRTLFNNVWLDWGSFITSSGGTMKNRLWFGNGTHNGYGAIASNQTELHLAVFADPENSNSPYTNLVINNGEDVPDGQRLRVSIDSMDGDTSLRSYFLIHSGNINDYISTSSAGLTPASIE